MSEKIRIELDKGQATIVLRALNLMAQQHFVSAIESDDELVRDRNYKIQDEYDVVFSSVYKQIADCRNNNSNESMKRYLIKHSQNDWEYTAHYFVYCKDECKKTDDYTIVIDNSVKIVFDETFELEKDELFATKL